MKNNKYSKIAFFIILLLIIFVLFLIFNSKDEKIDFYLKGNIRTFAELGKIYQDEGFVATNNKGDDLSEYVDVKSFININQEGTYSVRYILNKDGITKVLSRIVIVVKSINDEYFLVLNGDKNIKVLKGQTYNELGCLMLDRNSNSVNVNIEIIGNVDVNTTGNYIVKYIVFYNNKKYEIERNIEVYDIEYEYVKTNEIDGIKYIFLVSSEKYDYVKLPDGSIIKEKIFSYICENNGIYNFEFYDIYGNIKIESITVDEIIDDLVCNGVIDRYGTKFTISGEDANKFDNFDWYIDGVNKGSNGNNLLYKKVKEAYVVAKNAYRNIKIDCTITNKLYYDFEYDENNQKPFIECNTYTNYDRVILEEQLSNAIRDAGYGTRAGVVEAARFLVGGLDYKIPYLGPKKENSLLGRYEKKGLNIANSNGWGCSVGNWTQGIDCTNFVNWAFIQNGLQLEDVYETSNTHNTNCNLASELRVGDLMLTPKDDTFSHVGIIIGIDDNNIYVAESTTGSINAVVVTRLEKNNLPTKGNLSIIKFYNYEKEGNVTNMPVS